MTTKIKLIKVSLLKKGGIRRKIRGAVKIFNATCQSMQGTGKSYEVSGETTEWEDILIKKGITTKEDVLLSKGLNPEDVSLVELLKLQRLTDHW